MLGCGKHRDLLQFFWVLKTIPVGYGVEFFFWIVRQTLRGFAQKVGADKILRWLKAIWKFSLDAGKQHRCGKKQILGILKHILMPKTLQRDLLVCQLPTTGRCVPLYFSGLFLPIPDSNTIMGVFRVRLCNFKSSQGWGVLITEFVRILDAPEKGGSWNFLTCWMRWNWCCGLGC